MKEEDVKSVMESFRRVGDLDGAVGQILSCLPQKKNKDLIVNALKEFVFMPDPKKYKEHLEECANKIIKPKTWPKKKINKYEEVNNG